MNSACVNSLGFCGFGFLRKYARSVSNMESTKESYFARHPQIYLEYNLEMARVYRKKKKQKIKNSRQEAFSKDLLRR